MAVPMTAAVFMEEDQTHQVHRQTNATNNSARETVHLNTSLTSVVDPDPKLFAGSGSETGDAPYQKSSKNHPKISNLIIMTLKNVKLTFSLKTTYALKYHENAFLLLAM
jgi:hypothetical protein